MGIILCKEHGRNFIVHVSKRLKENYTNSIKSSIVKVIFDLPDIGLFVEYCLIEEDISNMLNIRTVNDFENMFISSENNFLLCEKCFLRYARELIILEKKVIIER